MHRRSTGTKRYHHPLVGDLTVIYQAVTPGNDPDQTLTVCDTEPGSASTHAVQLLTASIPEEGAAPTAHPPGPHPGAGSTAPSE